MGFATGVDMVYGLHGLDIERAEWSLQSFQHPHRLARWYGITPRRRGRVDHLGQSWEHSLKGVWESED